MPAEDIKPNFTHGEPISLTPPSPETNLLDKTLKVFTDRTVMNKYENDSKIPADNLGDSDLQRAVRMARLDKLDESKTLSEMDENLKFHDDNIKNRGWFEKLYDLTYKSDAPETRQALIAGNKATFLVEIAKQKESIGEVMDAIQEDSTLLDKAIERAYDEAQAIQRIALGRAIQEVNGGSTPNPSQVEQFAKQYNEGNLLITSAHLTSATRTYQNMVSLARSAYFNTSSEGTDRIAKNMFNPIKQVQET